MQPFTKALLILIIGVTSLTSTATHSATPSNLNTPQTTALQTEKLAIRATLKSLFPGQTPDTLNPAVFPNWFEAMYGTQILYVSNDGRYVISGDVYDMDQEINLTEQARTQQRQAIMQSLGTDSMIIFKPKKTKHIVTVFSDIDCSYCRKMHGQMDDYLAAGIEFHYLLYPRSGINTVSYYKAVSVWCSDDRQNSLTAAKRGIVIPNKNCKNPIEDNIQIANAMGVTGTPAILFANGDIIPGYLPPEQLADALEKTFPESQ